MRAYLLQIDAVPQAGGATVPVRLASHDDDRLCHLDAVQWMPGIAQLPRLQYDFFGGDFRARITTPTAELAISLEVVPDYADLQFADARLRIWSGDLGADFSGFSLLFDGSVTQEPQVAQGLLAISASPDDGPLDEPLLPTYSGTGGLEGPDDLTGNVKPLALGRVKFAPGVRIDAVDNVWQVSHRGVAAIQPVFDRVVSLGNPAGDYADLAALLTADIAAGSYATCLAQGLVRLGAPPDGQVSFHVDGDNAGSYGWARKPGAMIGLVAETAGIVPVSANLAALDTARPWNLGIALSAQTTARQVIQQIADSVCAVAGVRWTGGLFVQALGFAPPEMDLSVDGGGDVAVADFGVEPVASPFWRMATEAEITWVVHGLSEIGSQYVLRGEYSADRTYRLDDLVFADDGRSFVYINADPSAGNALPVAPETVNTHWQLFGKADSTADSQITFKPVAMFQIQADSENQTTSVLPMTRKLVLQRGGVDIAAGVTFSLVSVSAGSEASISGDVLTLSQADASGQVVVQASFSGVAQQMSIPIQRSAAGAPVGGLAGATRFSDTILNNVSSGTLQQVTDDGALVRSDTNGDISFSLTGQYQGAGQIAVQFRISADNTTFTDVGAEVVGSLAYFNDFPEPGFISAQAIAGGLAPDTDYYVAAFARRSSGSGTLAWQDTIFTAKQP